MTRLARLLVVAAVAAPVGAQAYYIEARPHSDGGAVIVVKYDTTDPVEYRTAPSTYPEGDEGDIEAAIEAAFETWADVECATIEFVRGDDVDTPMPNHWISTTDRYIQVYWSDDPALFASPRVGHFQLAHDGTGNMIGADIILNSLHHSWSATGEADLLDIQSVLTALIGRSFGITSAMEGNATYPRYTAGDTTKRELGDDDIAALQYLYGDGSCTPADPEAICDSTGVTVLPDGGMTECPPTPMTPPTDGGTAMPTDSGTGGGTDSGSGTLTDAGGGPPDTDGDDDGGCGCVAAGAPRGGDAGWLALGVVLLLGGLRLRRRR